MMPLMLMTLLGTGTPIPRLDRRGPATLLEIGNDRILVDSGSGVVHRLLEAGQPSRGRRNQLAALTRIYLTHLHSDHIMGLPDLLWTGWIMDWWETPPVIYGPPGIAELIARLVHTFEYDITVRNSQEGLLRPWITPVVREHVGNLADESGDFRATPFRVDHNPVDQAFGVRFDGEGWSVAFSGDTRPIESLAAAAHGVDILLHEVYDSATAKEQMRAATERFGTESPQFKVRQGIIGYHTLSEDLGPIAALADTPHLVLNHIIGPPDMSSTTADIARNYGGKVTVGSDLQAFELGN